MFFHVPTGGHKAFAEGSCLKSVECEVCGERFEYEVHREALGEDSFGWSETARLRNARLNAEKNLVKALAAAAEPIPCPGCGWMQQSMVEAVRGRSYPGLRKMANGFLMIGVGSIVCIPLAALGAWSVGEMDESKGLEIARAGLILAMITGTAGTVLRAIRGSLVVRYNPNREFRTLER